MVVACPTPITRSTKRRKAVGIPVIDLSVEREKYGGSSQKIVKACEEYGFFRVVNHGVPQEIISRMEKEGNEFFARPTPEKQLAGPPTPFGYGCKNIGFNGDKGELEYLLLHTDPVSLSQSSLAISNNPPNFRCAVTEYLQAVRNMASEILDLMAEGLGVPDKSVFSGLIRDIHSDSFFRLNHYPQVNHSKEWDPPQTETRMGFGEHSDPQIVTVLRSNDVGGLQICVDDELWVSVPPDPTEFCVFVGDALKAMTNGRFVSARHRVLVTKDKVKPRMSMMYFGGPPLNAWISPLPEIVSLSPMKICHYRPFTWAEFKKVVYSLRLGESRLNHFKTLTTNNTP